MSNEYTSVNERITNIIDRIQAYASEENIHDLTQINMNFTMKIEDFFREGRKLNIGVIGRVKAGKSSFLNTLLFNGEEVLPKAATPKTAALTKMEYAEENRIVVEFYSEEDWDIIKDDAKLGDRNEITKSAKELVDMALYRGINVTEILKKGNIDKTFEQYQDLIQFLNDYVGENGKYTPLVRSVVIYMNREDFKDISIVDTPGLNDPIPSRTLKTKGFIEVCDVVFFLSRAGSFLDVNDWELMCKQLPQKGVKKMILIASQYDNGIRDVLKKEKANPFKREARGNSNTSYATNIEDAKDIVQKALKGRISEKIRIFENEPSGRNHEMVLSILKNCQVPIMISSRAQDMSRKQASEYSDEEREDYNYWKGFIAESDMKDQFADIGNFDKIRQIYSEIKHDKEAVFEAKQKEFIPKVLIEVQEYLSDVRRQIELRLEWMKSNDKNSLSDKRKFLERQINAITADIIEVFGNTFAKISEEKKKTNDELRKMSIDAAKLDMHTGTETHTSSTTKYRFKLGFIRLGRYSESYTSTSSYKYLAAADALSHINTYSKEAASEIEDIFRDIIEVKAYRRMLLETVIRNFNASDEGFDANYFRIVVQKALNSIEFPEVHIDVSNEIDDIGRRFTGEIRNTGAQDEFRKALSVTVERIYNAMTEKVNTTIAEFRSAMDKIQNTLRDDILKQALNKFDELKAAMDKKESEIKKDEEYLNTVNGIISELSVGVQ